MIAELLKTYLDLRYLKFTESTIGKSVENIAHNRKLFKIYVKSLKNTCYGVHFEKFVVKKFVILIADKSYFIFKEDFIKHFSMNVIHY